MSTVTEIQQQTTRRAQSTVPSTRPGVRRTPARRRPAGLVGPQGVRPESGRPVLVGPVARPLRPVTRPSAPSAPVRRVRRQAPPVRLTRRGQVVVTLFLLTLALVGLALFSGQSAATGEQGGVERTRTVVVSDGDTLWDIASKVAEPGHTQEMVHHIEVLNSLSGPVISEGQELAVPVG